MAPELIMALVEDEEGKKPELTKSSDVYAFASVCLEVSCSLFYFFSLVGLLVRMGPLYERKHLQ